MSSVLCAVAPSLLLLLLLHTAAAGAVAAPAAACYDVLIVGGGPAGLYGAIAAARSGARVCLLERGTEPLRKVRISGGGRCNVMHDPSTWEQRGVRELLQQRYPRGAMELTGSLSARFSPLETQAWFEAEGVALKVEVSCSLCGVGAPS
jgi:hypothetical protein